MGDKGGTVIYLEYESFRLKFHQIQERFDEALTEKEKLITKAMPSATRYDKESVKCNSNGNPNEDYVIALEEKKIDEKISRLRRELEKREKLLEMKEKELRKSQEIHDKIYLLKKVDGKSIDDVAFMLNYSRSWTYKMWHQIQKRCGKMH